MAELADMFVDGAYTQLLLLTLGDGVKLPEKFFIGILSLADISHLSQLLHELADALAVLEWATFLESRAVASQTFALGNKDGIWALAFAKSWTLAHRVVQGNSHGGLGESKKKWIK